MVYPKLKDSRHPNYRESYLRGFCERARDPGVVIQSVTPTKYERKVHEPYFLTVSPFDYRFERLATQAVPMDLSVSPWDEQFMNLAVNAEREFESVSPWNPSFPLAESEWQSFSPFDDRFPHVVVSIEVWRNAKGMVRMNSRSHHSENSKRRVQRNQRARKMRKISRRLHDFAREPVVKRRMQKKAFRQIPQGLRFPSPGSGSGFVSVSPFDERFPQFGSRRIFTRKSPILKLPDTPRPVEHESPVSPFPALTPVANMLRNSWGSASLFFGPYPPPTPPIDCPGLLRSIFG